MNSVIERTKNILEDHYKDQFAGLILHGSAARGEAGETSDIDLLVLLKKPFDRFHELRVITDLLYPVQLESDRLISAKPVAEDDYESGAIQLYRNAKREGAPV